MSAESDSGFVVFLLMLVLCAIVGSCAHSSGVKDMQVGAVQRGFGEWEVAPDGSTTFVWKGGRP